MSATLAGKEISCRPEAGVRGKFKCRWGGERAQSREVYSGRENGNVEEAGRTSTTWYRSSGSHAALH